MKMKEIPFKGRRVPEDAKDLNYLTSGISWSGLIELPEPIWFNGRLCSYCNISPYGAIRFGEARDGRWHFDPSDKYLPEWLDGFKGGYVVVPWGDNIQVRGCGLHIKMWFDKREAAVVFDYLVRNKHNHQKYMFRVEFPMREKNVCRIYYYHCVSGYNTYLGVVLEPDDFIGPDLKPDQPYMKKAVEFLCVAEKKEETHGPGPMPDEDPGEGYEWKLVSTPMGKVWQRVKVGTKPSPKPSPEPSPSPAGEWTTVYQGNNYRVQERM